MPDTTVSTARYGTVVTATGAAKIAAGILSGEKINITHAAVGDGSGAYYMPTPAQTALLCECWRGEIASAAINAENENMIDVKFIVPAEVGGFTVREAALIDADGDTIAICNTPDAEKVAITAGVSFPLTMVVHIIVTDASAVHVTVNPSLDTVSRADLDAALAAHNADPKAHAGMLSGLRFYIGDTEPTEGNTLWFDTTEPAAVLLLDIGPYDADAEVQAEIAEELYAVENVGLNTTPTEDTYSLDTNT